jgi:uncharacterized protein (TIGR03000 family)
MRKHGLLAGVVTLAASLCLADFAQAQLFRRGRGGYGMGSGYSGSGYYGDGYYGNGYYGTNYGNGYFGNSYSGSMFRDGYYNDGYYGQTYGGTYYSNPTWSGGYNRAGAYYPPDFSDGQFGQGQFSQDMGTIADAKAHVMVRVPASDAQVWFDDHRTQQTGTQRNFDSPSLESGTYSYKIRAKWRQDGKDKEQTRTVRVQPGQRVTVDFGRSDSGQSEQISPPQPRGGNSQADQNQNQNQSNRNQSNQNQKQNQKQNNQNPPD